jgi:hypothetical protein
MATLPAYWNNIKIETRNAEGAINILKNKYYPRKIKKINFMDNYKWVFHC